MERTLSKTNTNLVLTIESAKIDNNNVSGYFSDEDNEIVITYENSWIETLVHEFNHYMQCKEESIYWTNLDYNNSNCLDLMWRWLDGEIELNKNDLTIIFSRIRDLEHDCEKRTVKMIKSFDLPIDLEKYICEANIYILFYNLAKEKRCWFPADVGPSSMKDAFALIPKTIYGSRTRNSMSKELFTIMEKYIK